MKLSLTKKSILILVIVAAFTAILLVAAAGYLMRSPDSPPLTVNPTPTPTPEPTATPPPATMSISLTPTVITVGEYVTLSTTVSDASNGLIVTFYDQNGTPVGTANTDSSGTATITFQPPVGNWIYHANAVHP